MSPAASSIACFFFLWLVVCLAETQPQDQLQVKTYAYASFQPSDSPGTLRVLKDASIHGGTLQLTPDGRNGDGFRAHKSGSVLLAQPFTLWRRLDDESPAPADVTDSNAAGHDQRVRVVSFNSTFSMMSVAYNGDKALPGEGLAFLIAPSSAGPPPGSQDGFLGLTNSTFEASSPVTNRFVAVEFDAVKQSYDPDDNHVGLDIGTVVSTKTASLADYNITMARENGTAAKNYTVWIEYDGVARHVWVYMDVRGKQRPASPVLDAPLDLSEHVPEQSYSYLGFSGSTGASTVELSSILDWTLTVETFPEKVQKASKYWWILIGAVFLGMIIWLVTGCIVTVREEQAMRTRERRRLEWLRSLPGMPTELSYEELAKGTKNFNERLREGWHGGYGPGSVYKGLLPSAAGDGRPGAMEVGVKTYNEDHNKFGNEIQVANRLRHHNIVVPIIGWCYKRGWAPKMLMVHEYEHVCNGSLDQHIFRRDDIHQENRPPLSWESRYRIVSDVASALHYMHHEHGTVVVLHGYVKPSSVMLDASLRARISDFVLARTVVDVPHCRDREDARPADVFAFGALVLEVVTGRGRRLDDPACPRLWDWVWQLHGRGTLLGAVDQSLGVAGFDQGEARRLLLLGLACTRSSRGARPAMSQVLQIVSKSAPPPEVPPVKPPEDSAATRDNFDDSFHFRPPPEPIHQMVRLMEEEQVSGHPYTMLRHYVQSQLCIKPDKIDALHS